MHVDKYLAQSSVFVLAGAQIDLVAADNGLLGISLAPGWEAVALGNAFNDSLDDFLRDNRRRSGVRRCEHLFRQILVVQQGGLQRLAKF